jgi:UDP-3-O-[3-hydroxymyristoyl] glucosamine N-acyltransferase
MITLKDVAARTGGELSGDAETPITGISGIKEAREGEITFLLNRAFDKYLAGSKASAIIAGEDIPKDALAGRNAIVVRNPGLAYARAAELFEKTLTSEKGVNPLASVSPEATVSPDATILPYACVGSGAVIEKDVVVFPFSYIGRGVRVGEGTTIHANVSIYEGTTIGKRVIIHAGAVIGSDGFAYVWDGRKHYKIPQLGTVEIEDEVEIGANTCIDRASLDRTVVRRGTKIDDLVMVGHNVSIGENSILVSQVGIAGSSTLGRNVILGGKAGVRDHVVIGDNVKAAGGTGITKDVKENAVIAGTPHMPHREWLRLQNYLRKLPELFERLGRIEEVVRPREKDDRDR